MSVRAKTIVAGLSALAVAPSVAAAPVSGSSFRDCRDCPEMVVIPAGRFSMGSPKSEVGRFENEGPEHPVNITKAFAIGRTDVTVAQYRAFVRATGHATSDECRISDPVFVEPQLVRVRGNNWRSPRFAQGSDHPVVCVTWDDAHAYIGWLNRPDASHSSSGSGHYRLPSEAEWEYAARAGTTTPYNWGATINRGQANYGPDEPRFGPVALGPDRWRYTSPSHAFPPNAFGLYDMAGNVWQFVEDCWHADYRGAPADGAAWRNPSCKDGVVRGGSWFKPPTGERSAKRGEAKAVDLKGSHEIGFRVVRDLD